MLHSLLAFSQAESEDDIFNTEEFDKSVEQGIKEDEKYAVDILFGGDFILRTSVSTPLEFDHYLGQGYLLGKPFIKISDPRTGFLYLSYSVSNYFFQTADSPAFFPAGDDLFAIEFRLSEFYLYFDIAKTVFIKLGNQINSWGASFFWTPADFINLERINTEAVLDIRTGIPALKIHIPFMGANLFTILDFSETVSDDFVVNDFSNTNAGLRFDFTVWDAQIGLMAYIDSGSDTFVNKYGVDLSTNILGFDLYTEHALTFLSSQNKALHKDAYLFAAGFERIFGEFKKWSVQGEFFFNEAGHEEERAVDFLYTEFVPFYWGRYYAFARVSKQDLFTDSIDAALSTIINFSDLSYTVKLALTFDIPNLIPLTCAISYNGGDQGDEFTLFIKNFFSLSAEASFTF
jgi:hypothetical protein